LLKTSDLWCEKPECLSNNLTKDHTILHTISTCDKRMGRKPLSLSPLAQLCSAILTLDENNSSATAVMADHGTETTTTTIVFWPFGRDYLGEPVPEETLTQPPS